MTKTSSEMKQLVEELNPYLEQKPPKITIDNIYKKGYGGGGLGGMMDKYKVKVSYLVDNKEKSSFEI